MQRRQFITLLGGSAAAWPLHARAQAPSALLRVGIVSVAAPRNATPYVQLDQRLRELGYVEGQNFALEFISLNGQLDRYGEAMKELVRRKVDIIIAFGTEIALKGAIAATDTLPIVMVAVDYDPLASGYVASLAHPGGRITGVFLQQIDLAVKRAQLMKDAFPDMRAATVFWDRISEGQWQAMQSTARNFGLQLEGVELRQSPYDYDQAIVQVSTEWRKTLFIGMSPNFFADRARLAESAASHVICVLTLFIFVTSQLLLLTQACACCRDLPGSYPRGFGSTGLRTCFARSVCHCLLSETNSTICLCQWRDLRIEPSQRWL
jgi:putative ABC transport system substrate-binding protein